LASLFDLWNTGPRWLRPRLRPSRTKFHRLPLSCCQTNYGFPAAKLIRTKCWTFEQSSSNRLRGGLPRRPSKSEEVCARSRYSTSQLVDQGTAYAQILGNNIGPGVTDWPASINNRDVSFAPTRLLPLTLRGPCQDDVLHFNRRPNEINVGYPIVRL
jgi:hypothetical protein